MVLVKLWIINSFADDDGKLDCSIWGIYFLGFLLPNSCWFGSEQLALLLLIDIYIDFDNSFSLYSSLYNSALSSLSLPFAVSSLSYCFISLSFNYLFLVSTRSYLAFNSADVKELGNSIN